MKANPLLLILALLVLLAGCALFPGGEQTPPAVTVQPVDPSDLPDPQAAAAAFLSAWEAEDYPAMYAALTSLSRDGITPEDFEQRYREIAVGMTLQSVEATRLSALTQSTRAQVAFSVLYHTTLIGDLKRDMVMNLSLEQGQWRVQWEDGLILPELRGGMRLSLEYKIPARGNIYDSDGHAIATQAEAVALGVVPNEIDPAQELALLDALSELTGKSPERIQSLYANVDPSWYVPVGETSAEDIKDRYQALQAFSGLRLNTYRSRYYYEGGVASQVVGYVLSIPVSRLEELQRKGYRGDERVGADGLEYWGETYLAGKHGASVYVVDPAGKINTRLAQVDSEPSQSIYTTLDKDLQIKLQQSLGDFRGAVVVMERDSGRLLALVSNPGFDPNLFEPTNANSQLLNDTLTNPDQPLLNRATQGLYPLGSVFKIITMAAALESGDYTPESTYACGLHFTELPGVILNDWTFDHGVMASGLLTLPEGLMRSCNPWFWHIGLNLFLDGKTREVYNMADAFGLGKETGIGQVMEASGNLPIPENEGDAVNQAIGQGELMITPLQVARFIAAVGNGGTLYRPQLVDKVVSPGGQPTYTFTPEAQGKLPLSAENLKVIQDALVSVVADRRGTAHFVLANIPYVAGKTGTAQTAGNSHAWFAGYTFAGQQGKPDIAVAVIVENGGEGSEMAAPIFRRAVSLYFSNNTDPGGTLPWESRPFVPAGTEELPTGMPTATP